MPHGVQQALFSGTIQEDIVKRIWQRVEEYVERIRRLYSSNSGYRRTLVVDGVKVSAQSPSCQFISLALAFSMRAPARGDRGSTSLFLLGLPQVETVEAGHNPSS